MAWSILVVQCLAAFSLYYHVECIHQRSQNPIWNQTHHSMHKSRLRRDANFFQDINSHNSTKQEGHDWEFTEVSKSYDKHKPPNGDASVIVILRKTEIVESALVCNLTVEFEMSWYDKRLVKDDIPGDDDVKELPLGEIWNPQLYALATPNSDHGEVFEWVFPHYTPVEVELPPLPNEGLVYIKSEKTLVTSSKKEYRYFPGDTHNCILKVATRGNEKVLLKFWNSETMPENNVFSVNINMEEVDFKPSKENSKESDKMIVFTVTLTRRMGNHLIQTYLPSVLFVVLSWLSMILPVEIAVERVALCTALLLTVTTFFNTARETGPTVHYLRALDVWLVGVIGFVFLSLFENIVILNLTTKKTRLHLKPNVNGSGRKSKKKYLLGGKRLFGRLKWKRGLRNGKKGIEADIDTTGNMDEEEKRNTTRRLAIASIIDKFSFIGIITCFAICNIIYWLSLYYHGIEMLPEIKED